MAVAAGAAVAMAIVFFVLGPRGDLSSFATLVSALLKVAITIVVLISASIYLTRLAWPAENAERQQYLLRRHLSP
jgi:hypothetical protein